ncbi:RelA/SpoT family protein [Neobacillus bataviensis]|uniref:RelA/SpoT family protein n=1 Tax=Neobacillus bataviensis TaxID=220685 RepID=A0A561CM81_9BACI|nr:hypothetical protein [Neobacillus bataviensis]TWD92204.1 RelA/SpoT family protein [Neobacillus bataviensis]
MNEQLKEFIRLSEEYLNTESKQFNLKKYKDDIITDIENLLNVNEEIKNYMLNGRIKKAESLKEKIIRKVKVYEESNGDAKVFIDKVLDDIIGVRIICLLNDDESKIYNILERYFINKGIYLCNGKYFIGEIEEDSFPYLGYSYEKQPVPQKNGKGIYKLKLKYFISKEDFINIELQIKSLTHLVWGELEHMLFYKNYRYNLDHDLHSKTMLSINKILEILDSQLKDLQFHLTQNNKIKDTQNMATKFLYNTIHDEIKHIHNTELDLREIYSLISQLFFYNCSNYREALICSKKLFKTIADLEIDPDYFNLAVFDTTLELKDNFNKYIEEMDDTYIFNEETAVTLNTLAQMILELSKGNDIFWESLLSIYTLLLSQEKEQAIEEKDQIIKRNFIDAILKVTYSFIKSFTDFLKEEMELIDFPENLVFINNIIVDVLNKYFLEYKKLDFFLETVHQNNIKEIIKQFYNVHKNTLSNLDFNLKEDLEQHDKVKLKQIIFKTIEIQVYFQLYGTLPTSELKSLLKECNEGDIRLKWTPRIHTQNLEKLSEGKLTIENIENLYIYLYVEEDKDYDN